MAAVASWSVPSTSVHPTPTPGGGAGRPAVPALSLLSAAPGWEFVDWGGVAHVGGGSHGSLHASDSLGALLWCGTGPASRDAREQWSLRDVAPIVRGHFGARSVKNSD